MRMKWFFVGAALSSLGALAMAVTQKRQSAVTEGDAKDLVDQSSMESFPASDPPSFTPVRSGPPGKSE